MKRETELRILGLDKEDSNSGSPDSARLLVRANEGWEEREIDLNAISAALAGATTPVRDTSLTALVRAKAKDIRKARKKAVSWARIADTFVEAGIPTDQHTIRKLYWRVSKVPHDKPRKASRTT